MQEIEAVQKSFPLHLRLVVIFRDFLIFQPLVFVDLGMIVTQKTAPECSTLYTVHTLVSFLKALLTSAISMKKHLEQFIEASLCKENNLRKCFCIKKTHLQMYRKYCEILKLLFCPFLCLQICHL